MEYRCAWKGCGGDFRVDDALFVHFNFQQEEVSVSVQQSVGTRPGYHGCSGTYAANTLIKHIFTHTHIINAYSTYIHTYVMFSR